MQLHRPYIVACVCVVHTHTHTYIYYAADWETALNAGKKMKFITQQIRRTYFIAKGEREKKVAQNKKHFSVLIKRQQLLYEVWRSCASRCPVIINWRTAKDTKIVQILICDFLWKKKRKYFLIRVCLLWEFNYNFAFANEVESVNASK